MYDICEAMSDSSDLSKVEFQEVCIPGWLYAMPESWMESYFDVCGECAISLKWGEA